MDDLDRGRALAKTLTTSIMLEASASHTPTLFWASFLSGIAGMMAKHIGHEATRIIAESIKPMVTDVIDRNTH